MSRFFLPACLLLVWTVAASAQDATKVPSTPPPTLVPLADIDRTTGVATASLTVAESVPVRETRTVIEAGVAKTVEVTAYRTVYKVVSIKHAFKEMQAYNVKGDKVPFEDAMKRLSGGSIVLIGSGPNKVDPAYLRLFKDDVLIFVRMPVAPK